jgi:hypothetical protein
MAAGLYNVQGSDTAGNISFRDSLSVPDRDDTTLYIVDTLRPTGAVKGVILLEFGADHGGTMVYVPGTPYITGTDAGGSLFMGDLPEGDFTLVIVPAHPDYGVSYQGVSVASGATSDIDTIVLKRVRGRLFAPGNFGITYDSLLQEVMLSWSADTSGRAKGYNLYRKQADSGYVLANSTFISDTVFVDGWDNGLLQDETYAYKLATVDSTDLEGEFTNEDTVIIASVYELIDSVTLDIEPKDIAVDGEGNIYITDGEIQVVKYDSSFNKLFTIPLPPDSITLKNPAGIAVDDSNYLYVAGENGITKFDKDGNFVKRFWDYTNLGSESLLKQKIKDVAVKDTLIYLSHLDFIALFNNKGTFESKIEITNSVSIGLLDTLIFIADNQNNLKKYSANFNLLSVNSANEYDLLYNDPMCWLVISGNSKINAIFILSDNSSMQYERINIYEVLKNGEIASKFTNKLLSDVHCMGISHNKNILVPSKSKKILFKFIKK